MWARLVRDISSFKAGLRVWVKPGEASIRLVSTSDGFHFYARVEDLRFEELGRRQVAMILYLANRPWETATEISKHFNYPPGQLSSYLLRLVKMGILVRKNGKGPRGGHGYGVAEAYKDIATAAPVKRVRPTTFERLGQDQDFDFDGVE